MATPSLLALFVAVGLGFFLLDQWTKKIVLKRAAIRPILWGRVLQIKGVAHRKRTYSRPNARRWLVLGWFAALAGIFLLFRSGAWFQTPAAYFGIALALGGAAGNLLDILRRRYILDFIDLRWWPVFNLADIGIIAGLLIAFWPGVGL